MFDMAVWPAEDEDIYYLEVLIGLDDEKDGIYARKGFIGIPHEKEMDEL